MNAETLTAVDAEADTALELGAYLVHGDVRSDNVCNLSNAGEREVRLVDWSHAGAGHELHDLVQLLPTLHLEGGPPPWQVCTEPAPLIARSRRSHLSPRPAQVPLAFTSKRREDSLSPPRLDRPTDRYEQLGTSNHR